MVESNANKQLVLRDDKLAVATNYEGSQRTLKNFIWNCLGNRESPIINNVSQKLVNNQRQDSSSTKVSVEDMSQIVRQALEELLKVHKEELGLQTPGIPKQITLLEPYQERMQLQLKNLINVFSHEDIMDKQIAIISVAGKPKTGKTFLLNFLMHFLRLKGYLWNANYDDDTWMDGKAGLHGFVSTSPATELLEIWSEIFYVEKEGKKVAVILMNTRGESPLIYALSTLISSVQIFNVTASEVRPSGLKLFQSLISTAKEVKAKMEEPVEFERFVFMIRDWFNKNEHEYGLEGGEAYLRELTLDGISADHESKPLLDELISTFDHHACTLLPFCGNGACDYFKGGKYEGTIQDFDPVFLTPVAGFCRSILSPENLTVKKRKGQAMMGRDMCDYIIDCCKGCYKAVSSH